MRKHLGKIAVLAFCAGLPLLMAPSGGIPSRPTFQAVTVSGAGVANATKLRSTQPWLLFEDTDSTANERNWYAVAGADSFFMGVQNDTRSASVDFLSVARTFNTVDSITLQAGEIVAKGTAAGASNVAYLAFRDSAGSRTGYVGDGGAGHNDIILAADAASANIQLAPGSGGAVTVSGSAIRSGAFARAVGGRVSLFASCSITSDYGLNTCTYNGAGDVTVTFDAAFASNPGCTASTDTAGTAASIQSVATGSVRVQSFVTNTLALQDRAIFITCIGP